MAAGVQHAQEPNWVGAADHAEPLIDANQYIMASGYFTTGENRIQDIYARTRTLDSGDRIVLTLTNLSDVPHEYNV